MNRRLARTLWPLALLLAVMAWRAAGCRGKKETKPAQRAAPFATTPHWITPLMTPPPPRPTVTIWKGVTRAPALPE
jgi:hypothetical protein